MSRFETFIDSKKHRVPELPNFFSLVGYDPFRFPHVYNYFILEGYVVFVQKNRHTYSVVCDGWCYSDDPFDCKFEVMSKFVADSNLSHVAAIEKFMVVCGTLEKCYAFDYIKRPRYEYILEEAERLAYSSHNPVDAEKILADKFGSYVSQKEFDFDC